ncbi:hypothetical protein BO86DRAFT_437582 [Aspergillus japonicus CBS 114.51]|uniref:Uncharacterized protein n=1 Tax=Aspergillus japonicus CBS 114.51 TaxID=1448312 RepID=A0A8T8WSS2_ASPJA|nr:hypothetical protein BO86DRAFT_437582 [Aspergillus japonicus CBS 114.51]RAH78885.1 hypothetical protein BO86DRAFT_437582 [Aspergillus japonicus CBS 114.51]
MGTHCSQPAERLVYEADPGKCACNAKYSDAPTAAAPPLPACANCQNPHVANDKNCRARAKELIKLNIAYKNKPKLHPEKTATLPLNIPVSHPTILPSGGPIHVSTAQTDAQTKSDSGSVFSPNDLDRPAKQRRTACTALTTYLPTTPTRKPAVTRAHRVSLESTDSEATGDFKPGIRPGSDSVLPALDRAIREAFSRGGGPSHPSSSSSEPEPEPEPEPESKPEHKADPQPQQHRPNPDAATAVLAAAAAAWRPQAAHPQQPLKGNSTDAYNP